MSQVTFSCLYSHTCHSCTDRVLRIGHQVVPGAYSAYFYPYFFSLDFTTCFWRAAGRFSSFCRPQTSLRRNFQCFTHLLGFLRSTTAPLMVKDAICCKILLTSKVYVRCWPILVVFCTPLTSQTLLYAFTSLYLHAILTVSTFYRS